MGKKVVREPLAVESSADVHHLVSSDQEKLDLGEEGEISIPYVRKIDQSEAVARELNIYLRQYAKRRGVANHILRYIRYVAALGGAISPISLRDYRNYLDREFQGQPSGKAQIFNHSRNFVAHFIASGQIPDEPLPDNLPTTIGRGTKRTFSEIAGSNKDHFKEDLADLIDQAKKQNELAGGDALTFAYCKESMRVLHEFALERIRQWEKDWDWIESLITDLSPESFSSFSGIKSFKASDFSGKRTFELAIQILASKYGRVIPPSTEWPTGLSDFLKQYGWGPRRVCGAFFPTTVQVGDFLTAILSHEKLKPNVDSVAFGLYIDQIKPAFEKGFHSIFFEKKRGDSTAKTMPSNDPLVKVLVGLQSRLRHVLPGVPGGQEHLAQHDAPIFIQITNGQGRKNSTFRVLDTSTTSGIVKRVIKLAAARHRLLQPLVEGGATGENFRPTHTAIKRLAGDSDAEIKRDLDHKNLSTTARYADRVETSSVIMGKYQDFQRYLVDEASKLSRTGSGYLCGQSTESACGDLHMCFSCPAKRIVLSSPEVASEWIAWRAKIESNQSRLEVSNPERWSNYWAARLAEYQALIEQLDQRTFKQASILAEDVALPPLD